MFAYATEVLHLSDAEAYLRIAAARASREHPILLAMLADGRLHLTAIAKLAPHLTAENREALLARAAHRGKREIEELVAELAPRPDVPALMRRLPERRGHDSAVAFRLASEEGTASRGLRLDGVAADAPSTGTRTRTESRHAAELRPDGVARGAELRPDGVGSPARQERPAVVAPLAPGRYKVQFTASAALREKLERLQGLMRASVPDGDLAAIIDQAVSEKLARLEARRFAQARKPRKALSETDTSPRTRQIPAAVKRAVYERDGGRCRYVDGQGQPVHRAREAGVPPSAPVRVRRRPLAFITSLSHVVATTASWPRSTTAEGHGAAPRLPEALCPAGHIALAVEGRATYELKGSDPREARQLPQGRTPAPQRGLQAPRPTSQAPALVAMKPWRTRCDNPVPWSQVPGTQSPVNRGPEPGP